VRQRLGIPSGVWAHMTGTDLDPEDGPPPPLPWYERMTPLMRDCYLALEVLHCTPTEYYRRTTAKERQLIGLYFGYKAQQEEYRDHQRERRAMRQAQIDQHVQHVRQSR
jgi:hypothetical protein